MAAPESGTSLVSQNFMREERNTFHRDGREVGIYFFQDAGLRLLYLRLKRFLRNLNGTTILGVRLIEISVTESISCHLSSNCATYAAQEQITALLRQRHRLGPFQDDDFTVRNLSEIAETAEATNRIMTTLLASIAAVSLLVGGIGIMNIMLVAVSERTREIGIRMAIGARPGHVRVQFLSESIVLCVCGGILGLALGVGGSVGISQFLGWPTLISPNSIVISIIFSGAIGIFFGYYPAHKAAGLDPIEALRYE